MFPARGQGGGGTRTLAGQSGQLHGWPDFNRIHVIYDSPWNRNTNYLMTFFGCDCGILVILTQRSPFLEEGDTQGTPHR